MEKIFSIVLADDDFDDQELIKQALQQSKVKVEVSVVYNGLQLMDYLLKKDKYKNSTHSIPDLILLDLNMPLMDGFQALKEIKQQKQLLDVPVYVITTSNSARDKTAALELGATGFYSKGGSAKELRRVVQEVCHDCFA